jgi:hypothetical protein
MKRRTFFSFALIVLFLIVGISQTKKESKSDILQSFRPRGVLLNEFIKKCGENRINLLLVEDKMANRSKMTRFTTYKTSLIYISRFGKKRLTYLFNFKDDTLFTVKSY